MDEQLKIQMNNQAVKIGMRHLKMMHVANRIVDLTPMVTALIRASYDKDKYFSFFKPFVKRKALMVLNEADRLTTVIKEMIYLHGERMKTQRIVDAQTDSLLMWERIVRGDIRPLVFTYNSVLDEKDVHTVEVWREMLLRLDFDFPYFS